mgnify:CR=1 FL=1
MHQKISWAYFFILLSVSFLNYIPGVRDTEGLVFGIFALDLYDDALHLASAIWAGFATWKSAQAAKLFLSIFGFLYLLDGLLGLVTGSGYLDLGILNNGVLDLDFTFKLLANLPHIALGAVAVIFGVRR